MDHSVEGQGTAQSLWEDVSDVLRHRVPTPDYLSWFSDVRVRDVSEDEITLACANTFAVSWIRKRFYDVVVQCVQEVTGREVRVELVADAAVATAVDSSEAMTAEQVRDEYRLAPRAREATGSALVDSLVSPRGNGGGGSAASLNPRYRFDTFVIGEGSQLAHAAALNVAESPGQSYNPLFVYGPTGLGKTHLLHAIGHFVREAHPELQIAYVTTEQFVNRFVQAMQMKTRDRFKEYFRGVDVLLVDDVQFLSGKGASLQEEFFHTFNALHEAGRQVVLSSDREPSSIPALEERLRSRFAWGLITDIEAPDRETRIAILRKRADADRLGIPADVLTAIAERITTNVRELEGALTRVVGAARLSGRELTPRLADRVLDSFAAPSAQPVTIDRIQEVVCEHFRVSHDELVGQRRSHDIARPRQVAMYLARVLLGAPSTLVGKRFGGRDHTTVLHAERKIDLLIKQDPEVFDLVEQLTAAVRGPGDRPREAGHIL